MKTEHQIRRAIGIDFGGTTVKTGLVEGGQIVQRGKALDTRDFATSEALVAALCETIATLAQSGGVEAIGVGLPGLIDSVHGVVHSLSNVPGWRDVELARIVHDATGLTTWLDNDANAMAYGEWRHGAAQGLRNVVFVTLGTGVGGGLVLNGQLYRGAQLGAGEIGQMSVDYQGVPGAYGNSGALDKMVGNAQIEALGRRLLADAGETIDGIDVSPRALAERAEAGDAVALQVWAEIGDLLGAGLANVLWLLNPEALVIGGGVAKAGEVLFSPLRASLESRLSPVFHEALELLPAALGNDAGIIGAAAIALDQTPAGGVHYED